MQQQGMYTRQQSFVPHVSPSQIALDNLSDASSDAPSKIKNGPNSIDLENIIKTMNEKKQQKNAPISIESEDDEKQIKQPLTKKGRPRKQRAAAAM